MDGKTVAQWAVGIGILVLVWRMFKRSDDEKDAGKLESLWELMRADPVTYALDQHIVPLSTFQGQVTPNIALQISKDVHALHEAPSIIDDNELAALASIMMRPNYANLLMFSQTFAQAYDIPVGVWLLSFLSPTSDEETLGPIVRHVLKLRP